MKTTKIDLTNFNRTNLLARLLCLSSNYLHNNSDLIFEGKDKFLEYCKKICTDNFTFPEKYKSNVINNFALFLLGSPDNSFDKAINQ